MYTSGEQRPLSARGAKKKEKSTTVNAVKEQRAKTEGREAGGDRVTREERLSVAWQQNIIRCDGVGGMKGKMGCGEE